MVLERSGVVTTAQCVEVPRIDMEVQAREQRDGFLVGVGCAKLRILHQFFGQRFDLGGRHVVRDQGGERGGVVVCYNRGVRHGG